MIMLWAKVCDEVHGWVLNNDCVMKFPINGDIDRPVDELAISGMNEYTSYIKPILGFCWLIKADKGAKATAKGAKEV